MGRVRISAMVRFSRRFRRLSVRRCAVAGRRVVIIDDLVQTGGTLAECALICKAKGCAAVSCFCTHSVFPNESWRRFCAGGKNEGLFERFYVSNTIPNIAAVLKGKE